ncbi:SapC family protein [Microbulbifer sp. VTAC004]|uniref:SapC family protein n=1 Tax=Microbulbifer TaxID=48073 RepID=UPI0004778C68|nr:SapC family protein [Microbulbifer variabilis]
MIILDKNKHHRHSVLVGDISHSDKRHVCPVYPGEFHTVAQDCPVVFAKSDDGQALESCAMLGIKPGKNLFWQEGKWQGTYIPAVLRAHPFYLHYQDVDSKSAVICIDSSALSAEAGETAHKLFEENGEPTQHLAGARNLLYKIHQQKLQGKEFIRCLTELDLLQEQVVLVDLPGNTKHHLTGVFCVSEKRLNELDERDFLTLRKRGYLAYIYAHIFSLKQSVNLSGLFKKYHARSLH